MTLGGSGVSVNGAQTGCHAYGTAEARDLHYCCRPRLVMMLLSVYCEVKMVSRLAAVVL